MPLQADTLKILKAHNIRLNRRKGQNYLVNPHILAKILKYADLSHEDTVLEIGAGIGTLTIPMADKTKMVTAIEQDKKIAAILKKKTL